MDKTPPIAIDVVPNHGGHAQPKRFNLELAKKLMSSDKFQLPEWMQKLAVKEIEEMREDLEFLLTELRVVEHDQDFEKHAEIAKRYNINID